MRKVSVSLCAAFVLFLCLVTSSCNFNANKKYDVYKFWMTQSDFYKSIQATVKDGKYYTNKLSDNNYDYLSTNIGDSCLYEMTEDDMLDWCYNMGFGEATASEAISWFVSVEHGWIWVGKNGNVYCLLK